MSKKYIGMLLLFLLALAAYFIWGSGIYYGQYLNDNYQSVSVRTEDDNITGKALKQALENEEAKGSEDIPEITAWNRSGLQSITDDELGTEAKLRLIEVYGNMSQVFPMVELAGSIPFDEDYESCLITEDVACELFHTKAAAGNFLRCQGEQYIIRGVFKAPEPMLLIHKKNDEIIYPYLELTFSEKENGSKKAKDFIKQNALAYDETIIDGLFYSRMLEMLYRLPAWCLGFCLLYQLIRQLWKRRSLPIQIFILAFVLILMWILLQWLMEFGIILPERLIPTKWSDFAFWSDKYKEIHEEWKQISYLLPLPKDILFIHCVKNCILCSAIALTGMAVFISHRSLLEKRVSGMKLCLIAILMEGAALYLLYGTGRIILPAREYLFMIPVFLFLQEICRKGKKLYQSKQIFRKKPIG